MLKSILLLFFLSYIFIETSRGEDSKFSEYSIEKLYKKLNCINHNDKFTNDDCHKNNIIPLEESKTTDIAAVNKAYKNSLKGSSPKIISHKERVELLANICDHFRHHFHQVVSKLVFNEKGADLGINKDRTHVKKDPADILKDYKGAQKESLDVNELKKDIIKYTKSPPCLVLKSLNNKCMESLANGTDIDLYMSIIKKSLYISGNNSYIKQFEKFDKEIQMVPFTKSSDQEIGDSLSSKDIQLCLADRLSTFGKYKDLAYFIMYRSKYSQSVEEKPLHLIFNSKDPEKNIEQLFQKLKIENGNIIKRIYEKHKKVVLGFSKEALSILEVDLLEKYPNLFSKAAVNAIIKDDKGKGNTLSGEFDSQEGIVYIRYTRDIKHTVDILKSNYRKKCGPKHLPKNSYFQSYAKYIIISTLIHESAHSIDSERGDTSHYTDLNGFVGWIKNKKGEYTPQNIEKIKCNNDQELLKNICNPTFLNKQDLSKGFYNLNFYDQNYEDAGYVSSYSFQSASEDFAETVREFLINPDRLKKISLQKYEYIRLIMK